MTKIGKLQPAMNANICRLLQVTTDIFWSMSIGIDDDPYIVFAGQFPER